MKLYKALYEKVDGKLVSASMFLTCLEIVYNVTPGVWNEAPLADRGMGIFVFTNALGYSDTVFEVEAEEEMPLPSVFYNNGDMRAKSVDEMRTTNDAFPANSKTFKRIRFIKQLEDERQ